MQMQCTIALVSDPQIEGRVSVTKGNTAASSNTA